MNATIQGLLVEIQERAEMEAEALKRAGEKQENYRVIAQKAKEAIRLLSQSNPGGMLNANYE